MQTLTEHNQAVLAKHNSPRPAGVSCPECSGVEMQVIGAEDRSHSPGSVWVSCSKCGHRGIMLVDEAAPDPISKADWDAWARQVGFR